MVSQQFENHKLPGHSAPVESKTPAASDRSSLARSSGLPQDGTPHFHDPGLLPKSIAHSGADENCIMAVKPSFFGRGNGVMPPLAFDKLQQLQAADLELDALRAEVAQIEAALADQGEIEAARRALASLTTTQEQTGAALRDAELALATLTAEVEGKSQRLYSGNVVNPRELEALQADIAQLTQQRAVREDHALQAMVAAEEAEEARAAQHEQLDSLETTFASKRTEYDARLRELAAEIASLETARAALLEQNDPTLAATYTSLRARLGGQVLAPVSQGRCTFCHIALPDTQLRHTQQNQELVYCDTCGRLLFTAR